MKYLRKLGLLFLNIVLFMSVVGCTNSQKESNKSNTSKINLVTISTSPYHAPLLVGINNGYFKDEGLDIELSTLESNSKILQQVLSGSCDIGFGGPEQGVFTYLEGKDDYAVVFAQCNQKNGGLLLSREKVDNFNINMLKGKTIIGSRPGGSQENTLEYILKQNNIDPKKDINIITNVPLDSVPSTFKKGEGDYAVMFEPAASILEKEGIGTIVTSLGEECGEGQYTSFYTSKSYLEKNPETLQKFTNALYKGQQYVKNHSPKEIAKVISTTFPEVEINDLEKAVQCFKDIGAYKDNPQISEEQYNKMLDITESYDSKLIPKRPDFDKLNNNTFAKKDMDK